MGPHLAPRRSTSSGFTLVEIAIVIVIAGILLAMSLGIVATIIESTRIRATRTNMDTVRVALLGFIARNGRLPCPAVEAQAPSADQYGLEAATPGTCTATVDLPGLVGPPAVQIAQRGVLPWKTLGLTLENATDGWGNQFTYMVTRSATGKNFDTVAGMRGSLYLHSGTPVVPGLPVTGNQTNACSATANDNTCNRAAVAVLISHGRNTLGAYPISGVRAPLPTGAAELENTNADRFVVSTEPGATYDDMVLSLTPDDLLAPLAAQGAIKSERALLQERARQFLVLLTSTVSGTCCRVSPSGGGTPGDAIYTFPTAVSQVAYGLYDATRFDSDCDLNPPATIGLLPAPDTDWDAKKLRDPWGQELRYICTNCAVNQGESCRTPVVVVSPGPDQTINTADDIIYYASLAEIKDFFARTGW